jgi:hypothetical protein
MTLKIKDKIIIVMIKNLINNNKITVIDKSN